MVFELPATPAQSGSGVRRRHYVHGKVYNEAIQRAASAAGIEKRVTSDALRHSFATDWLEAGTDLPFWGLAARCRRPRIGGPANATGQTV